MVKNLETCPSCGKKAKLFQLPFMPRGLCKQCFCRGVEHRVRKEMRTQFPLKKQDTVLVLDDGSREALMLLHILKRLQADFPFKLKRSKQDGLKQTKQDDKRTILAVPWSLDDAVVAFLKSVLFDSTGGLPKHSIAPLRVVHPAEIELFCQFRDISGQPVARQDKVSQKILESLGKLEVGHPQIKFSVLKFSKKI